MPQIPRVEARVVHHGGVPVTHTGRGRRETVKLAATAAQSIAPVDLTGGGGRRSTRRAAWRRRGGRRRGGARRGDGTPSPASPAREPTSPDAPSPTSAPPSPNAPYPSNAPPDASTDATSPCAPHSPMRAASPFATHHSPTMTGVKRAARRMRRAPHAANSRYQRISHASGSMRNSTSGRSDMTRYACVSMMTPRMPSRTNQPRQRFRRNPSWNTMTGPSPSTGRSHRDAAR